MIHSSTSAMWMVWVAAFILVVFPSPSRANDWDFVVAPYILLPNISGDASVGRVEGADVDVDTGDILDTLELGAMIQLEARHKSGFGVLLNYAFMDLGKEATGPRGFTRFDADVFQGILEGYVAYRIEYEWSTLDAYIGMRWWDINIDIDATTPLGSLSFDRDEDWVDPVVGGRWLPRLAARWRLHLQGDIGGFGLSSDFTWNTMAGIIWDSSDAFSVALLYRLLSADYDTGTRGTPDRFAYNTITQGPILGVVFRF